MDGSTHFQFQGQASQLSKGSTPGWCDLILAGDQRILRSIITIAVLEGNDQTVCKKPSFMFGDEASDTDQQLLAGEGQWVYTIKGEKYYLPSSKRHYSLFFFQSVTTTRKMNWPVI